MPGAMSLTRLPAETIKPVRKSKLARPFSAPLVPSSLSRVEHEEDKKRSEWLHVARHKEATAQQKDRELWQRREGVTAQEKVDLQGYFEQQEAEKNLNRRRQGVDRRNMQRIERAYKRDQQREQQEAKALSLEAATMIKCQLANAKKRRDEDKAKKLQEEERDRQECARLLAEEKAAKAAAKAKREEERRQCGLFLEEQTRLKKLAAKEEQENEIRMVEEYKKLVERQEAARAAKLQAMADDQARRMNLNADVQKAKANADEAMNARIERHLKEKYEADDAKARRESAQRAQAILNCDNQRKEAQARNQMLEAAKVEEGHRFMATLEKQHLAAVASDEAEAAERKNRRKDNQTILLAQMAEKRVELPVHMSKFELDLNSTALRQQ